LPSTGFGVRISAMQLRKVHRLRQILLAAAVAASAFAGLDFFLSTRVLADEPATASPNAWLHEATNHVGSWIWETNTFDKQAVHLWKVFEIPAGKITAATLRITVDNGYTLFLDGQELGRGSDWRTVTEYNLAQFLKPGRHIIAVDGFNDRLEGGLIFGLYVELAGAPPVEIDSDESWFIAPLEIKNWQQRKYAPVSWHHALVLGPPHHYPWQDWPLGLASVPPLKPVVLHFWQRGWFQITLSVVCAGAVVFCLWLLTQLAAQTKAQKFLQVERARIARDIHDDLGAQLTQLLLLGEVAQREHPEASTARGQFTQLCTGARALAHALDEIVWAVNSRRDTVRDFTSYVCKYAQIFLDPTGIRCRLDVEAEMPATAFDLPLRRNLFLAVKEALNNAAKYSQAQELFLRIFRRGQKLLVVVEDNGVGFDPEQASGERNGLTNMAQRMAEIGGTCALASQPGAGCRVTFAVPLPAPRRGWFRRAAQPTPAPGEIEISGS